MPQPRTSAPKLPTILIVIACASIASYFAFFRGKANPSEPTPSAAAAEVVVKKTEPAPAPAPAAPKHESKSAPKVEPPPPPPTVQKSAVHEIEELCAQSHWR